MILSLKNGGGGTLKNVPPPPPRWVYTYKCFGKYFEVQNGGGKHLSKLYVAIRSILWGGCSAHDIEKFVGKSSKSVSELARIVTSLPIFAPRKSCISFFFDAKTILCQEQSVLSTFYAWLGQFWYKSINYYAEMYIIYLCRPIKMICQLFINL